MVLIFWADWLMAKRSHGKVKALDGEPALERRRYIRQILAQTYTDAVTGEKAQNFPMHLVKAGIMGAAVNAAQCKANETKEYRQLITIIRNSKNLTSKINDLRMPSSIIPTPEDIEELASTPEGMARLELHAKELIRRAEANDPYEHAGQGAGAKYSPKRGANRGGYRGPDRSNFDVNSKDQSDMRQRQEVSLRAGTLSPHAAWIAGCGTFQTMEEAEAIYNQGAAQRGAPSWAEAKPAPRGPRDWYTDDNPPPRVNNGWGSPIINGTSSNDSTTETP